MGPDENTAPFKRSGPTCYHCPRTTCGGHFYLSSSELGRSHTCSNCGLVVTIGVGASSRKVKPVWFSLGMFLGIALMALLRLAHI